MWCLGTSLSVVLGSVRLMVALDDPKSLFQPKQLYDSNQCQSAEMFLVSGHVLTVGEQEEPQSKRVFLQQGAPHSLWPFQVGATSS